MASTRPARVLAPAMAIVTVGLFITLGVLGGIGGGGYVGVGYVVASLGVGLVLAWHLPRNPIGWLLMAIPAFVGAFQVSNAVCNLTYHHHPLVTVASFAATQLFYYAFLFTAPVVLLVFPDGGLPSPRWRLVLRAYLVLAGGVEAVTLASVVAVAEQAHLRFTSSGSPVNGPPAGLGLAEGILVAACLPLALAWVARRIVGYRRTTGVIRQQFKWLALGACCLIVALVVSFATPGGNSTLDRALSAATGIVALPFPLTVGVAVLRFRLYDIDRVISRTLSYAALTALLVGVYVGMIALMTRVLAFSSPVGVAASTLAAVALFSPLRRRVQHLVDRRFNRARYDAEVIVDAFAARLREAIGLETIREELAEVVQRAVEPAQLSVWVRPRR